MTPERLDQIRTNLKTDYVEFDDDETVADVAIGDGHDLVDYIDTLTSERDEARALTVQQNLEIVELRRGQGRAPTEQGPGDGAYHRTNPIPDSTKAEQ